MNRQDVQPEPEILTKHSLPDRHGQVFVGRRDDTHVHREGSLAAHAFDDAVLEYAQQFRLRLRSQVSDLVEEQSAAVRQLEPALPPLRRAREGAAFVSEHLRLDQITRDRGAIDGDERLVAAAPRALPMDRRGDQLLAGAGFARDQHTRFRGRDARDQRAQLFHRNARSDEWVVVAELLV